MNFHKIGNKLLHREDMLSILTGNCIVLLFLYFFLFDQKYCFLFFLFFCLPKNEIEKKKKITDFTVFQPMVPG